MNPQTFCSTCLIVLAAASTTTRGLVSAAFPAPSREDWRRQGEKQRAKPHDPCIRTLRNLAHPWKSGPTCVVEPSRAESSIAGAQPFTEPAIIVDPGCILGPDFVVQASSIPTSSSTSTSTPATSPGASSRRQQRRCAVSTGLAYRPRVEVANLSSKVRLERMVGAVGAVELTQRVRSGQAASILDPDLLVFPAFLVDSRIVVRGRRSSARTHDLPYV